MVPLEDKLKHVPHVILEVIYSYYRLSGMAVHDHDTFIRLCRSRDVLAGSYCERITLEQAAQYAHSSPFHFHRLFTRAFGQTPHEFLTHLRIDEAKRLLAQENDSVTDVCFTVGYSSLGTFSSRFRALVGQSPSEYRREARRVYTSSDMWRIRIVPACFVHLFSSI